MYLRGVGYITNLQILLFTTMEYIIWYVVYLFAVDVKWVMFILVYMKAT